MNRIKRFILPVAIILIGAGAAFATNVAKESDSIVDKGYYYDNSSKSCVEVEDKINCTTTPGTLCTWKDSSEIPHNLYQLEGPDTSCINQLYQPK